MSPLPATLRDRWLSRDESGPDQGTIYWHMLMRSYPAVREAAEEAQGILRQFDGMHLTPVKWLHITTLIAGSTDEISRSQMNSMLAEAQRQLRSTSPIPVTIGKILYHPEAIMLRVDPKDALLPILGAAQVATQSVTGKSGMIIGEASSRVPHVTVSYSTAQQPAGPIISALGKALTPRTVVVDSMSLVIQWGSERLWDWELVGTVQLGHTGSG